MLNLILLVSLYIYVIPARQLNVPHLKPTFECSSKNPCPKGRICVLGSCRETETFKKCPVDCPESTDDLNQVCGSDGHTYDSTCVLEKLNCETRAEVFVQCHQKCPCNDNDLLFKRDCKLGSSKNKLNAYFHQASSEDFSKLLKSSRSPPMLFMEYVQQQCQYSTKWAFAALDFDRNGFIDQSEQSALTETFNDVCVHDFIQQCDANKNKMLSINEFCYCLKYESPPCHKALDAVPVTLKSGIQLPDYPGQTTSSMGQFMNGSYIPMCDDSGYFLPRQSFGDMFWCVDDMGDLIVDSWVYDTGTTECYQDMIMSSYFPIEA